MKTHATAPDRIPSLDGLRAISIAMVLLGHLAGTRNFPLSTAAGNFLGLAEFGVGTFFVISGFLITRLLLDELGHTGRISIRHFYLRRTLRIFPPYYVFLGILAICSVGGRRAVGDTRPGARDDLHIKLRRRSLVVRGSYGVAVS